MSTLREAAIGAMGALETARNGLAWYRDRYPESTDGSDDEAAGDIDAAIDALRAELAKPDARPAPAEPQGAEAPQEIKSLRDRIIEGELELDGTHPPTLMFLMAEHWKAVATEHYAKAKDYDRLKHELRLSRTAPAPRPAGGEPVAALIRHRSLQTEARIAHDGCDHYSDWSDWEPATVQHALAVTDPARNTHPLLWEARLLVDCQPQPAAQQEPLCMCKDRALSACPGEWEPGCDLGNNPAHARPAGYTQAGERKPLTDEQIDRHSIAAVDCPPSSTVILVSSLRRLLGITATKGER